MKIDINKVDLENFMMHPHLIAGEICWLIQSKHIGAKWDKDNLIYRSSVWNSNGDPVSLSFPKFFNFEEQPDLAYKPFSLTANGGCQLIEKIDGSTLIISRYKGQWIYRTRGTVDATKIDNGYEIEILKEKYPNVFKVGEGVDTMSVSYLFEWVSPVNRIVLNYGDEPDIYLIGAVDHTDYSLFSQDALDTLTFQFNVKRPKRYNYESIAEMIKAVDELKGQEGLCVYCNKGQTIRKVKSAWYLALHRMKAEFGSIERVIDFYFTLNRPTYQEFYNHVSTNFDFEIAEQARGDISRICEGMKEVNLIIASMTEFAAKVKQKHVNNRKLQAADILQAYGNTNRSGMVFALLDGRLLTKDDVKKLLYQVLKK